MKLVTSFVLVIAIALFALGFLGKRLGLDLFKLEKAELPSFDLPSLGASGTAMVNKWQDEQGQWHFSNGPPGKGVKAQQMMIDTGKNVVQPIKTKVPANSESALASQALSLDEVSESTVVLPSQHFLQQQKENMEKLRQQAIMD
jgi:hypothetical protein